MEIGKPRRVYTIEPAREPVPGTKKPERAPEPPATPKHPAPARKS